MKKKEARKLSIKKWKYIVENGGSDVGLIDAIPKLKDCEENCGYCEKYEDCIDGCPLHIFIKNKKYGCSYERHPFSKWFESKTKKRAQIVLDLIRNT